MGKLSQGNDDRVKANYCVDFLHHWGVPNDRKSVYENFVCYCRPLKSYQYRIRFLLGGDKPDYAFDAGSPTSSMLETKILVDSVISDAKEGAWFMICDLKCFFLCTTMDMSEFMQILYKYFLEDIIICYNIEDKFSRSFFSVRIKWGIYGLKQTAILAYDQLVNTWRLMGITQSLVPMQNFPTKHEKSYVCV